MSVGIQVSGVLMRRLRRVRDGVLRRLAPPKRAVAKPAKPSRYPPNEKLCVGGKSHRIKHVFDDELLRLQAAAEAHHPSDDWGPEYEVVKAAFDPLFYLSQNQDIRRQAIDPVGHYLRGGAREGRDPAPWFSTDEYRRAYLGDARGGQPRAPNPFYHYLTVGRAAGHAPRAPANYDGFCKTLGLSAAQTSDLVTQRMLDVRDRLLHGGLGDMVMRAAELDPLIAQSWTAGLKVRVPPASNAIGVRRIGHLIDLQDQAGHRRGRAVIVMERAQLTNQDADTTHILDSIISRAGGHETVVVVTDGGPPVQTLAAEVRVIDFKSAMPRTKGYQAGRTLVEFIRSLRPCVVINLNAPLMNRALRAQGRAVAATSVVYQYLPQAADTAKSRATLGSRFYRAVDLHHRVIVPTAQARSYLVGTFALTDQRASRIWVTQSGCDHAAFEFDDAAGGHHGNT